MKLFLIGCGFTRAVFPKSPLNNELLPLLAKEPQSASLVLKDKYETCDIEHALTRLDLDIAKSGEAKKDQLSKLRESVTLEIVRHFEQYRISTALPDEKPWIRDFFLNMVESGDCFLSLNYDCVLEGLMDSLGIWTANGGYGTIEGYPTLDKLAPSPHQVLKLHGSVNFHEAPMIDDDSKTFLGFSFSPQFFPRSAANEYFGVIDSRPYIIAPSYTKIPHVQISRMMLASLKAANEATTLIVIGCSLRSEDTFLKVILTKFFCDNNWKSKRIIVVDTKADQICDSIKAFWEGAVSGLVMPIKPGIEEGLSELSSILSER